MKKSVVIHPFLFAIYPILFIFSYNIEQASFNETFLPAAIALGFTLLLLSLSGRILKDIKKAGIIVSLFLVFFFSYGHVYNMINLWTVGNFVIGRSRYLLLIWGLLIACSVYLAVRTRRDLNNLTKIFNIAALSLVVISLVNVAVYEFRKSDFLENSNNNNKTSKDSQNSNINSGKLTLHHDIYYIILDGYANSSTLKEVFNYDNSEFTDYLTKKGFYLSAKSLSNYAHTIMSLSSSLNMEYINYLSKMGEEKSKDYSMLTRMIQNSKVINFLKSKGYKFINISSGWGPTGYNKQADLNFFCSRISEFYMILIQTTMLSPFEELINDDLRNRILCIFSKLAEVHKIKGPKFIFAHIISPHPPFVFGQNGENVPEVEAKLTGYVWKQKGKYINQLIFINKKVKMLVDEILSKSKTPPIIILQADHGSASTFTWEKFPAWDNPTTLMLKERMRIFNAYYLPSGGNNLLYDSITPVNTFRFIFNFYFNTNYKLLNDEVYFSSYNHPYKLINVTKKVRYE